MLIDLQHVAPNVPVDQLKSLISFGMAIQAADQADNLPDFALDNLHLVAKMMVFDDTFSLLFLSTTSTNFQFNSSNKIRTSAYMMPLHASIHTRHA